MKFPRSARHIAVIAAGLLAASLAVQAAPIDFVHVTTTVGGAIGGGGNTLTYSSLTGLTSTGTALPPSAISQTVSTNTSLLNQTSDFVAIENALVNGAQTYSVNGYSGVNLSTGIISRGFFASGGRTEPGNNGLANSSGVYFALDGASGVS